MSDDDDFAPTTVKGKTPEKNTKRKDVSGSAGKTTPTAKKSTKKIKVTDTENDDPDNEHEVNEGELEDNEDPEDPENASDGDDTPSAPATKLTPIAGGIESVTDPGEKKVLEYLMQANRPYSHVQIFENLHKAVKKVMVPRILDSLTDRGLLQRKDFKKTRLYMANQANFPPVNPEELARYDQEIKDLQAQVAVVSSVLDQTTKEVSSLASALTDEQLDEALAANEAEVNAKKSKLDKLTNGSTTVLSKAKIAEYQASFNYFFTAWKSRKRAAMDCVETYMENAPPSMKKKKFMENQGIEDDEEAKIDIKKYEQFFKK